MPIKRMRNIVAFQLVEMITFTGHEVRIMLNLDDSFEVKVIYDDGKRISSVHNGLIRMFSHVEEILGKQVDVELRRQMLEAVTNVEHLTRLRNQLLRMERLESVLNFQRQIDTFDEVADAKEM